MTTIPSNLLPGEVQYQELTARNIVPAARAIIAQIELARKTYNANRLADKIAATAPGTAVGASQMTPEQMTVVNERLAAFEAFLIQPGEHGYSLLDVLFATFTPPTTLASS